MVMQPNPGALAATGSYMQELAKLFLAAKQQQRAEAADERNYQARMEQIKLQREMGAQQAALDAQRMEMQRGQNEAVLGIEREKFGLVRDKYKLETKRVEAIEAEKKRIQDTLDFTKAIAGAQTVAAPAITGKDVEKNVTMPTSEEVRSVLAPLSSQLNASPESVAKYNRLLDAQVGLRDRLSAVRQMLGDPVEVAQLAALNNMDPVSFREQMWKIISNTEGVIDKYTPKTRGGKSLLELSPWDAMGNEIMEFADLDMAIPG